MSGEVSAKLGAVRVVAGTCGSVVEGLVFLRGILEAAGGLAALVAADTTPKESVEGATGEAVVTAGEA